MIGFALRAPKRLLHSIPTCPRIAFIVNCVLLSLLLIAPSSQAQIQSNTDTCVPDISNTIRPTWAAFDSNINNTVIGFYAGGAYNTEYNSWKNPFVQFTEANENIQLSDDFGTFQIQTTDFLNAEQAAINAWRTGTKNALDFALQHNMCIPRTLTILLAPKDIQGHPEIRVSRLILTRNPEGDSSPHMVLPIKPPPDKDAVATRQQYASRTRDLNLQTVEAKSVLHEIAHLLHERYAGRYFWRFQNEGEHLRVNVKHTPICGRVSVYACDSPLEFVAEVFTGAWMGISFSDEVLVAYVQFAGPRLPAPEETRIKNLFAASLKENTGCFAALAKKLPGGQKAAANKSKINLIRDGFQTCGNGNITEISRVRLVQQMLNVSQTVLDNYIPLATADLQGQQLGERVKSAEGLAQSLNLNTRTAIINWFIQYTQPNRELFQAEVVAPNTKAAFLNDMELAVRSLIYNPTTLE